ncbi:unnamed protein product [Durusdinium trenchii]|uniref:Tyr recombinase domain-containing protein n=1 Tax=Durusdinium trenchii TaxID=1381693 RepID=A0ABP0SXP8_9DINO
MKLNRCLALTISSFMMILLCQAVRWFRSLHLRWLLNTRSFRPMEMSQHFKLNKTILFRKSNLPGSSLRSATGLCCSGTSQARRNGSLVLYTREHKTSAVGIRREQYLPLVIPWEGVVSEDWIEVLLKVYEEAGLDMTKVPLGPLLPAPKIGGGFCARPLSTQEAARWLRLLLSGTPGSEKIRCHSLKATLLNWCAEAGLDKEVRAVLGHHSTALHGSDIVYSRELQVRPLRKLQMLLKSIRIGLNLEDSVTRNSVGCNPRCDHSEA